MKKKVLLVCVYCETEFFADPKRTTCNECLYLLKKDQTRKRTASEVAESGLSTAWNGIEAYRKQVELTEQRNNHDSPKEMWVTCRCGDKRQKIKVSHKEVVLGFCECLTNQSE